MLLTTLIIDFKVVLTAGCRASDQLDIGDAACSLPPSVLTIILKTAGHQQRILCVNLQYIHFNLINTVAVRNVDHIGCVTKLLYHARHHFIMRSLRLNYSINKT